MRQFASLIGVSALVLALLSGGLTHDLIKHDHGHGTQESAMWQELHKAVRHDDKKSIPIPALATIIIALALTVRISLEEIPPYSFKQNRYLTKGIAPYRRFS